MLTHLSIQNFTLVEHLDLDLKMGMTVITGETGAGKSVLLEALGQTLGDRADATRIRQGTKRADVSATFHIASNAMALTWLKRFDLEQNISTECILRRVITTEGRSKAYINGHPVTLSQLKGLGEMLIDIHSQHEHQSLLIKDNHRQKLDEHAGQKPLAHDVKHAFEAWHKLREHLEHHKKNDAEQSARQQLLSYQVHELEHLSLSQGELGKLEQEQHDLANAEAIAHSSQQVLNLCDDDEHGLQKTMQLALTMLNNLTNKPTALIDTEKLLKEAHIQTTEAQSELERYIDDFEVDPERLKYVEERLSSIYEIARKHRIQPQSLPDFHQALSAELASLSHSDAEIEQLETDALVLENTFREQASVLSNKRHVASKKFADEVNHHLASLAMEHAKLSINLTCKKDAPSANGLEDIEFLITTNPGQPPLPLAKVASGGELSRISLAIQVVSAKTSAIASLVFDEVDVGIGGATGDIVGKLLKQLAETAQILCVTHLPQVASKGHQHLKVEKSVDKQAAQTALVELNKQEKIEEIARMLGGIEITSQSLAHAKQILSAA